MSSNAAHIPLSTEELRYCCSSDDGYKVSLHEIVVRRYTRLFDQLDPKTVEEMRDPFGGFVFILQSVDCQTLAAMADLLYTGECGLTSVKARHDLESLLGKGVEATDVAPAENKVSSPACGLALCKKSQENLNSSKFLLIVFGEVCYQSSHTYVLLKRSARETTKDKLKR